MAGTVSMTTTSTGAAVPYSQVYAMTLTSTAGGAVSGNAQTVALGQLVQVKVIPAAGGTQPTDLFDLTLLDADGVDVLSGAGANKSNASATATVFNPPVWLDTTTLDPVLANAGSAKVVTVKLFVRTY